MRYFLFLFLFGVQTVQAQESLLTLKPDHIALTFWVNVDPTIIDDLERGDLVDLYHTSFTPWEYAQQHSDAIIANKAFDQVVLLDFNVESVQIVNDYSAKILVQLEFPENVTPKLALVSEYFAPANYAYFITNFWELVMTKTGEKVASEFEVLSVFEIKPIAETICTVRVRNGYNVEDRVIPCRD